MNIRYGNSLSANWGIIWDQISITNWIKDVKNGKNQINKMDQVRVPLELE